MTPFLRFSVLSPLFATCTQICELDADLDALDWHSTSLPQLHLTSLTLLLASFDDASFLRLAEAAFGTLRELDITLDDASSLTEAGVDLACANLPSTLLSLRITSSDDFRPRQRLVRHFPHLSSFFVVAHLDPIDIFFLLPPSLRKLEISLPDDDDELGTPTTEDEERDVFLEGLLNRIAGGHLDFLKTIRFSREGWERHEYNQWEALEG